LARTAAEAIKTQWELLGKIKVKIVELPDGQSMPKEGTADLVYVVAAVWEPLTDARRLLGPQGLAKNENQLVGLGLRRLENEFLWQEISPRLHDLHFISHHELPVLPLWQMVDSYAYRKEMGGIGSDIVSLYQNVEKWRLKF
ncbi:MAG: peptide ABC transporter substrate-binding protein, partial [Planctomycetota bacterium]